MNRSLIILASALCGGPAAAAPLGKPADFVARVQSGKTSLETFDFAKAGYWTAGNAERAVWLAKVQPGIFGSKLTSETCDRSERRRFANAMWLMVLMQSPDESTWAENAGALRGRLRQLDADLDAAAQGVVVKSADPRVAQLERRIARDQGIRDPALDARWSANLPAISAKNWFAMKLGRMMAIDCDDTEWLKAQLEEIGWFDIETYGKDADKNAWLLVQHADRDPPFQRWMLGYLQGLPPGKTDPHNVAYLFDRVAVADKRPQRYGTQGSCGPDGGWQPFAIEDPERVDDRRASAGLAPLAEYVASFPKEACPAPAK